jgi:anti-anti-sigma factor
VRRAAEVPIVQIDTRAEPTRVVVAVSGEIDISVHDAFAAALTDAVGQAHGGQVIVDLSQTLFLDASGIQELVGGRRTAAAAGVDFTVTGASGIVALVLGAVGLLEILTGQGPAAPRAAAL